MSDTTQTQIQTQNQNQNQSNGQLQAWTWGKVFHGFHNPIYEKFIRQIHGVPKVNHVIVDKVMHAQNTVDGIKDVTDNTNATVHEQFKIINDKLDKLSEKVERQGADEWARTH